MTKYNQTWLIVIINGQIISQLKFVEENPKQLTKYQALDSKKKRMQAFETKLLILKMKGDKKFKFKDTSDFNSYYTPAQRVERQQNQKLFKQKYGNSTLAYRSIGSQSEYNPQLLNQFRSRQKQKQINPPMKYSIKISYGKFKLKRPSTHLRRNTQKQGIDYKNDYRCKSMKTTESQASFHTFNQNKSSYGDLDEDQQEEHHIRPRQQVKSNAKKQSHQKSYFNRIIDIQQISDDPHIKKSLHNILLKIGKAVPNSKKHSLSSAVDGLSSDIL